MCAYPLVHSAGHMRSFALKKARANKKQHIQKSNVFSAQFRLFAGPKRKSCGEGGGSAPGCRASHEKKQRAHNNFGPALCWAPAAIGGEPPSRIRRTSPQEPQNRGGKGHSTAQAETALVERQLRKAGKARQRGRTKEVGQTRQHGIFVRVPENLSSEAAACEGRGRDGRGSKDSKEEGARLGQKVGTRGGRELGRELKGEAVVDNAGGGTLPPMARFFEGSGSGGPPW